jgi:general secretion pathway protein I
MANVSHTHPGKQAGFSLLETIAAILLLALAFGAVMHVAGAATELTGRAKALSRVSMLADTTLDAAGRLEPLREGIREGWYDKRYRWRTVVTAQPPAPGQTADLHVYRIDLDVMWRDGLNDRRAHFATLRLQDEPKPPAPAANTVAGS